MFYGERVIAVWTILEIVKRCTNVSDKCAIVALF